MKLKETVQIARIAIDKKMTYEQLKYSDYMNGKEDKTHIVYDLVVECDTMGYKWFKEKYSKHF